MALSKINALAWASRRLVLALVLALSTVGCSGFDESFGLGNLPSSQSLSLQSLVDNSSFETVLHRSDSIRNSNIGLLAMGIEKRPIYGERKAAFFTEFVPIQEIDEDDDDWEEEYPFGYNPIFDSLMFCFMIKEYSGDTTVVQTFDVYEARNTDFILSSLDSVYFHNFDIGVLDLTEKPLFSFTFPDQENEIYTNSTAVRMYPYEDNMDEVNDFIGRMLLTDDNSTMDIYDLDQRELFLEKFKGIYIVPTSTIAEPAAGATEIESSGAIYTMSIDAAGLRFYARSIYRDDISIVRDTVTMSFGFRDISTTDEDDYYYGLSVNTIEFVSDLYSGEPTSTIRVEAMGGVTTKISITKELFLELDRVMNETLDDNGESYNSIFMNRAQLNLYLTEEAGGTYDSQSIQPMVITPWLDLMPERLVLYSVYTDYYADEDDHDDVISTLTGIEDYAYDYELYYGTVLPFGGYLNRSLGCYEMVISSQLQEAWNSYLEAKEDAGGDVDAIDWDNDVTERTFYIGAIAEDFYSVKYASLQSVGLTNNAPMELKLTYTLVK